MFVTLQTIERIIKEQNIHAILLKYGRDDALNLYENLDTIRENYRQDLSHEELGLIEDWISHKRVTLTDLYKSNTKQVDNNVIREKSKYQQGAAKREVTPILESSMENRDKFEDIYNQFSNGDEYFQMNTLGQRYLYMRQIRQYNQFDSNRAKKARTSELVLEKSGQEYTTRIKNINDNVESFIKGVNASGFGGNDVIWDSWYIKHNMYDKYMDLKKDWNDFLKENMHEITFEEKGGIYYMVVNGVDTPYEDIETFLSNKSSNPDIRFIQGKLTNIYKKDLYHYIVVLSGKSDQIFRQLTRYGVMTATREKIKNELFLRDNDLKEKIINSIDFIGYSKKPETRSRSHKIIPKKNNDGFRKKSPKKGKNK